MTAQNAILGMIAALLVGFILGAIMGDVLEWYYRRQAKRRYDEWTGRYGR